jgi:hypothetical protein
MDVHRFIIKANLRRTSVKRGGKGSMTYQVIFMVGDKESRDGVFKGANSALSYFHRHAPLPHWPLTNDQ